MPSDGTLFRFGQGRAEGLPKPFLVPEWQSWSSRDRAAISRIYARANHRSEMWIKLRSDWLWEEDVGVPRQTRCSGLSWWRGRPVLEVDGKARGRATAPAFR